MKRKFMCLFLALAMAFSCFAFIGCSDEGDETVEGGTTDESALTTVTLTLWIPTNKNTTEEAILAVQEAINKITKAKFETAIELHAIPEDQYDAAVDARITEIEEKIAFEAAEAERKRQEAKELAAQGITTAAEETTAEETTAEEETTDEEGETVEKKPIIADFKCEKCGADMVQRSGKFGTFFACSRYPECNFTKQKTRDIGVPCPKCGSKIVMKNGRNRTVFYSCEKYPTCDFSSWDLPVAENCPDCGAVYTFNLQAEHSFEDYLELDSITLR